MLSSSEGPKALEASQHVIGLPCIMHRTKYHTMMTSWHGRAFPLLALCEGNPSITGGFPHKGPVMQFLMCHLFIAWIIFESNNGDGNGWRHSCDVAVMICINFSAMDVSYDYTDSAVTRSDVTSGQAGAKEESARVAASGSDMQNGVSTSKGTKRKRKTRRGRKNQVASEAAEVGKGEGAPQANWGVHALNERFVGLHFWDRRWFYYMGFSLEECNTLLYFGYTPWQNDCQQMSEFLERYNSGRPEYYYLWCPILQIDSRPAPFIAWFKLEWVFILEMRYSWNLILKYV